MNRNLFLLAAALQLPVALWMQGCGKDEETSDDQTQEHTPSGPSDKPPAGPKDDQQPPATEPAHKLNTGRDQKERIQKMLSDERVQWPTDVEHMYDPNTPRPTAHVLMVDTFAERQPKERGNTDTIFLGFSHKELVDAFSFEAPKSILNELSRKHPAVVSPKMVAEWTEEHTSYVILDSQNTQFVHGSAASFVIAQNCAPSGKDIDESEWNLVAEVYTARNSNKLFPKKQPNNLMTISMPYSDVPEVLYEIAYKAFTMVLFHNVAVTADVDPEQIKLHQNMHATDLKNYKSFTDMDEVDIFSYFEDTRAKKDQGKDVEEGDIIYHSEVGACHGVRATKQNNKMIEEAHRDLLSLVKEFREHIVDLKNSYGYELPKGVAEVNRGGCHNIVQNTPQADWEFEKWNLKYFSHFEAFVNYSMTLPEKRAQTLLERIRMKLDVLYKATKSYEETKPKKDEAVDTDEWYVVRKDTFMTHPTGSGHQLTLEQVDFSFREGHKLAFPKWFVQNLFTEDRAVLPAVGGDFEDFQVDFNDKIEKPCFHQEHTQKFTVPEFQWIEALDSYIITDLVFTNPGNKMHSESALSTCLGLFDAMEDMTAKNGITKMQKELGSQYVLGEVQSQRQRNSKDNQNKWVRKFKGDLRDVATIKEEHFIKTITFQTLKSQVGVEDLKTIVTKASAEEIVEDVKEEKIEIKIEETYQPRSQKTSRTIQPNQGGF